MILDMVAGKVFELVEVVLMLDRNIQITHGFFRTRVRARDISDYFSAKPLDLYWVMTVEPRQK